MLKPAFRYRAPNSAATSGRTAGVIVPAKIGGPPDAGYAHAWIRETPVSVAASRSAAPPERTKVPVTVVPFAGVPIQMNGFAVAAVAVASKRPSAAVTARVVVLFKQTPVGWIHTDSGKDLTSVE